MWAGVHHRRPVGPHPALQQELALQMRPEAEARGLVPVLGAYEPSESDGRSRASERVRGDQAASALLAVEITTAQDDAHRRLSVLAVDWPATSSSSVSNKRPSPSAIPSAAVYGRTVSLRRSGACVRDAGCFWCICWRSVDSATGIRM